MRTTNVNWSKPNKEVIIETRRRARKAAPLILAAARRRCPVGTITRPMYKTGRYANQPWTRVDIGTLKDSGRIVEKQNISSQFSGSVLQDFGGIRVYFGHYFAWYAPIVEFYTPYLRPAVETAKPQIRSIMENG